MKNTNQLTDLQGFPKIARLSHDCYITEDGQLLVGARRGI